MTRQRLRAGEPPHPALIEALAADVNALRQERGITFEQAYDEIAKPDWVRQYKGTKTDLENQVISKAKSIARGRRGVTREAHHVVRDFSTLPDLVKHAKSDLGATHVSGQGAETRIYFPLGSGQYEEATVWQKGNYWHATGPGARQRVAKPPRDARPITQQGMRWASETNEAPRRSAHSAPTRLRESSDTNFQSGERVRIRVIGSKGQLADPPFWYTTDHLISLEELALQFAQTIQPGMFVSISDGKNNWTFQKETHAGRTSVRRTHRLPTARYR